jgi:hypothetical protein
LLFVSSGMGPLELPNFGRMVFHRVGGYHRWYGIYPGTISSLFLIHSPSILHPSGGYSSTSICSSLLPPPPPNAPVTLSTLPYGIA